MKSVLYTLTFLLCCTANFAQDAQKILFIRGGDGTGGFLEGGADHHLCNIDDYDTWNGNHGWGTLADALRDEGFELTQMEEGPVGNSGPIDLLSLNLSDYDVIVMGSNNVPYPADQVDAFESYIKGGGAALFISDANFGLDWDRAPTSDQSFLDRFGWVMNQDQGTYTVRTPDFSLPGHPILEDVSAFMGEGVSPITVADYNVPEVTTTIIVPVPSDQFVQRNDRTGSGATTPATADDAVLVVATVGAGRIAGHFDRNTFFNLNGAGTDITEHDNRQYAVNLFKWLAGSTLTAIEPAFGQSAKAFAFSYQWRQGTVRIKTEIRRFRGVILDTSGRILQRFENEKELQVGHLAKGFYILNVNNCVTYSFVIP
ncbi:MAG: ThuA domain-containing protein [Saprospiraceae bacterium]|nr:ThuA domain-containing protein [Saprospiraceae bacterium]